MLSHRSVGLDTLYYLFSQLFDPLLFEIISMDMTFNRIFIRIEHQRGGR